MSAPLWAVEAARRSAGTELQAGNGIRCAQEDEELAEYSFELFAPGSGAVLAHINVFECGVHFVEVRGDYGG